MTWERIAPKRAVLMWPEPVIVIRQGRGYLSKLASEALGEPGALAFFQDGGRLAVKQAAGDDKLGLKVDATGTFGAGSLEDGRYSLIASGDVFEMKATECVKEAVLRNRIENGDHPWR